MRRPLCVWRLGASAALATCLGVSAHTPTQPLMAEVIATFSTDVTLFKPTVLAELARQASESELTVFVPTDRACAARGIHRFDDAQAVRLLRSHAFKGSLFDADTLAYLQPGPKGVFALGWRAAGTDTIQRIANGGRLALVNLDGRRVTMAVAGDRLLVRGYGSVAAGSGFDARDGRLVLVEDCRIWDGSPHPIKASPHAP